MRRKLFPPLATGYRAWLENDSLEGMARAAGKGREQWHDLACEMLDLHTHLGDAAGGRTEKLIKSDAALL